MAKQTVHRWWSSKVDILMDALADKVVPPGHGDLATDLREYLATVAEFLTTADAGATLRVLLGQAQHDPDLAARLRTEHPRGRHARDRLPFDRAAERGELPADFDVAQAVEQLLAPIHYRLLVIGAPVPREFTDALVERFFGGLGRDE